MDSFLRRHQAVVSAATAILAPSALVLTLYWGHLDGITSAGALDMMLVAGFLYLLLRLVILPVRFGEQSTRGRRFLGAVLATVFLGALMLLNGRGISPLVGIGITVLVFGATELGARWD